MLSIIVAHDEGLVIGRKAGGIPWQGRMPADVARFRQISEGHPIIMGRAVYEELDVALPNRQNIVLSRAVPTKAEQKADFEFANSPDEALILARSYKSGEEFVIGGGQIYKLFFDVVERLYITVIHTKTGGDVLFPQYRLDDFKISSERHFAADAENQFDYTFMTLDRLS